MIFYSATRFFYAIRKEFVENQEYEIRIYTRLFRVAVVWELSYLSWRYWQGYKTGTFPVRPQYLEIPLLLSIGWNLTTLMRTWAAAEKPLRSTTGLKERLRSLLFPQSQTARFLRDMFSIIIGISITVWIVIFLPSDEIPLWLPILYDTILLVSMVHLFFVYLQMHYLPITLEFRVLGAGLTLFLAITYLLGWAQTTVYLNQVLPGVPVLNIVGIPSDYNFVVPLQYRTDAIGLHQLLTPLVWFEIIGGFIFAFFLSLFYRTTLRPSLYEILQRIEEIEKGNLDHHIPVLWQDEFGRIALAINELSVKLKKARMDLLEHQKSLEATIEERTNQLELENDRRKFLEVKQAIQEERKRIGEEAHDGLLQSLMGIGIRLRRAPKLSRKDAQEIETELLELEQENQKSVKELRQLIKNLSLDISKNGMLAGIRSVIYSLKQSYAIKIDADFNYPLQLFDVHQELDILRVVQEALSNACKHSQGKQISISIQPDSNAEFLLIRIEDDGVGFASDIDRISENHWGINNMKNRADRLDATLDISTTPEAGTKLFLNIPCRAKISTDRK